MNKGARDGAALHAEIQKQGWAGSARTVRRYLAQFREPGTAPAAPPAVPKARPITRLLLTRPDHWTPKNGNSSPGYAPAARTSTPSPAKSPRSPR